MARTAMRISSVTQYPIKSCGGMTLEQAEIDESGLRGDRLLFVIDENGEGLGQVAHPRMALIQPSLVGTDLSVSAPGQGSLEIPVIDQGELRQTKHWHQEAPAVDQGDEAARWFSEFLGTACRLMGSAEIHKRTVPEKSRRRASAILPACDPPKPATGG